VRSSPVKASRGPMVRVISGALHAITQSSAIRV
jgi:hypothetical protein